MIQNFFKTAWYHKWFNINAKLNYNNKKLQWCINIEQVYLRDFQIFLEEISFNVTHNSISWLSQVFLLL